MRRHLIKLLFLAPIALLSACSTNPVNIEDRIIIKNFIRGPICGDKWDDFYVCADTEEIQITGKGICTYNKQPVPCTWYGFSFDYVLPAGSVKLECVWKSSTKSDVGNPREVKAKGVDGGTYEFELNKAEGHYIQPNYTAIAFGQSPYGQERDSRVTVTCSHRGMKVFEYAMNRHFPS